MSARILLVNRDRNIMDLLKSCLESEGYRVITALNEIEGKKALLTSLPDVIILDVFLPAKGAVTFLRMLLNIDGGTALPLIIMGDIRKGERQWRDTLEKKFNLVEFLQKPFRVSKLLQIVQRALRQGELVDQNNIKVTQEKKQKDYPSQLPSSPKKPKRGTPVSSPPESAESDDGQEFIALIEPDHLDMVKDGPVATPSRKGPLRTHPSKTVAAAPLKSVTKEKKKESSSPRRKFISATTSRSEETPASESDSKATIIIVDDEVMILKILTKILESAKYRVISTYKSTEALKLAVLHKPALVISDIMMPDLDGYKLCTLIKSRKELSHTKVILLTAKHLAQDKGKSFKCGADFFMSKPINQVKLLSVIENLIDAPQ